MCPEHLKRTAQHLPLLLKPGESRLGILVKKFYIVQAEAHEAGMLVLTD